ncbi:proteophosphoglycan 5, partial [Trichoderma arundinaceum]
MEAHASPIKATPGRRRHPRGGKPAALKAYASENDAASYALSAHHRAPQTPKKILTASPAPADSLSAQPGSKPRNRSHKPKGKNDPASPNYHLSNSQSPPRTSPTSKAISSTPFAGATFHASPAPSDLPIPSFLKSSSESPMVRKPRGVIPQPSPPATDSELPTPHRPISANQHRESPLDFMFRAHREEKARQNFDSSTITASSVLAGAISPPRHLDTPLSPTSSNLSQGRRTYSRQASGG